jgi:hypothetical protein
VCPLCKLVDNDEDHVTLASVESDEKTFEVRSDGMPSPWRSTKRLVRNIDLLGWLFTLTSLTRANLIFDVFVHIRPIEVSAYEVDGLGYSEVTRPKQIVGISHNHRAQWFREIAVQSADSRLCTFPVAGTTRHRRLER